MRDAGIEVNGVAGVEFVIIHADFQSKLTLHYVKKLGAGVLVRFQFLLGNRFEFGEISIGTALVAFEVEALKVVGDVGGAGAVGQLDALVFANDRDNVALALVCEKVVEAYAENERDTKQRGQGGKQLVALQLREQRRRQASVLAEFNESQALLQAQCAKLGTDLVGTQIVFNRLANHGKPRFSCHEKYGD